MFPWWSQPSGSLAFFGFLVSRLVWRGFPFDALKVRSEAFGMVLGLAGGIVLTAHVLTSGR